MPELPEVETVRRLFERALAGHVLADVEVAEDDIVLEGEDPAKVAGLLKGRKVVSAGRKGKFWWLEMDGYPWLYGHLGMAGWVRELGESTIRLREHGQAPFEDEEGRTRFLKIGLTTDEGRRVVMTDGRRLSRLWLGESPLGQSRLAKLGPDCLTELPDAELLHQGLVKRKAPLKAILLDQGSFAGVGNWIADEVLYQARLAPGRLGSSLTLADVRRLRSCLQAILELAVRAGADASLYPEDWMFHHRWGGKSGSDTIGGMEILREQVGGRTTAWVPGLQL